MMNTIMSVDHVMMLCRALLNLPLSRENHVNKFSVLLHVEETQMEVDIRKYDMENAIFTTCPSNKRLLTLQVRYTSIQPVHLINDSLIYTTCPSIDNPCLSRCIIYTTILVSQICSFMPYHEAHRLPESKELFEVLFDL